MDLAASVSEFVENGQRFVIAGGGSKSRPDESGLPCLDTAAWQGIISYEPSELVLRAKAGTRIADLKAALAAEGQVLAFEPPAFDGKATLGGTVATARAGSRRPYAGAVRDFVLGVGLVTGQGEYLEFGGQVMKNVAGFDVSRLMVGARGSLGVIADVSLKVLPAPVRTETRRLEMPRMAAHEKMLALAATPQPVTGLCHIDGAFFVRLAGSDAGVTALAESIGGEVVEGPWEMLDHYRQLPSASSLWRISVAAAADDFLESCDVMDWGGAQRWLADPQTIPSLEAGTGHASLARGDGVETVTLSPVIAGIHRRLKKTFDPAGLVNPGAGFGMF